MGKTEPLTMAAPDRSSLLAALDSMYLGVIITDADGRILFANRAYSRILCRRDLVLGRYVRDVEPSSPLLEVLASLRARTNECVHVASLSKDVVASILPLYEDGRHVGAVAVFQDRREAGEMVGALGLAAALAAGLRQDTRPQVDLPPEFAALAGKSARFVDTLRLAARVAATDSTVVLLGENGTGKEVLAGAIAQASGRRRGPFVRINCAAIPEELLESELFGYEAGAFTGARSRGKPGRFELANRGTLLLDEIGDMSLRMQVKVLRALESREVQRLGADTPSRIDVRLIAATNRNLAAMVRDGAFRGDLYYRLSVFPIQLPPLRERPEDVPLLAVRFLREFGERLGRPLRLAPEAVAVLVAYQWPGNVRELRNAMEYAATLCADGLVTARHLPAHLAQPPAETEAEAGAEAGRGLLAGMLHDLERRAFIAALQRCNYNCTRAMAMLGLGRQTFYRRLHEFGLNLPERGKARG